MTPPSIRIATRHSALALWQARHVQALLRAKHPQLSVDLVEVTTTGDRVLLQPLRDFGGQGAFTREVQSAVLEGRADLAVHSLKDLPTEPVAGLALVATPPREVTDDALVLPVGTSLTSLQSLPAGARVGTGSPRRQAQVRYLRPDLHLQEIRGNVETRLRKLDAGEFDAIVLAAAGLIRLGLANRITQRLSPPTMYPAVSQGVIGLECRAADETTRNLLATICDPGAWTAAVAERALLAALRAGCHAPVGVHTVVNGDRLSQEAVVLSLDGTVRWLSRYEGAAADPVAIGRALAERLIAQGAAMVLSPK